MTRAVASLHRGIPWEAEMDMERKRFENVRNDARQTEAVRKIASRPVVVVSGRGGTGKTEVVTAALEEMAELEEEREKREKEEEAEKAKEEAEVRRPVCFIWFIFTKFLSFSEGGHVVFLWNDEGKGGGGWRRGGGQGKARDGLVHCPNGEGRRRHSEEDQEEGIHHTLREQLRRRVQNFVHFYIQDCLPQILASYKMWRSSSSDKPWKFSFTRVVAVDESSMVSLSLFASLLKTLTEASSLRKVVLLGDRLQLPSIDPGNLMSDLCAALRMRGCVVELEENHRSNKGDNIIFENARLISEKKMPNFSRYPGF